MVPRALDDEKPQRRGLRRLDDGLVCPPSIDGRLGDFVRQHFSAFDMPPPVAEQLLASAPKGMRSLSAAEVRGYVKRKLGDAKKRDKRLASRAWAPLHSANFALDLLAYCASDLHGGAADVAASPLASALSRSSLAAFASASSSTRPSLPRAARAATAAVGVGGLAPLGPGDYVVAGAAQQALLPHLAPQLSPPHAPTTRSSPLFRDSTEWLRALKLRDLTLELLARAAPQPRRRPVVTPRAMGARPRKGGGRRERAGRCAPSGDRLCVWAHEAAALRGGEVVLTHAVRHTFVLPQALLDATLPRPTAAAAAAADGAAAADAEAEAAERRRAAAAAGGCRSGVCSRRSACLC